MTLRLTADGRIMVGDTEIEGHIEDGRWYFLYVKLKRE